MVTILGRLIKEDEVLYSSLSVIFGLNRSSIMYICVKLGINWRSRIKDLSLSEVNMLSFFIEDNFLIESDLRRELKSSINYLSSIRSYRGLRHELGLPLRGQRTRSNSKTQKKLGKRRIN